MQPLFQFISRAFLGTYFLYSGCLHLISSSQTLADLHSAGVPWHRVVFGISVGVEIFGGLLILLGARVRWAGGALALLMLFKAYFFHRHIESRAHLGELLLLLALVGGLLQVAMHGAGRFSLDRS